MEREYQDYDMVTKESILFDLLHDRCTNNFINARGRPASSFRSSWSLGALNRSAEAVLGAGLALGS